MDSRTAELPLEYLAAPWQIRLHIPHVLAGSGRIVSRAIAIGDTLFSGRAAGGQGSRDFRSLQRLGQPSGTFGEFVGYSAASSRDRLKLAGVWGRNVAVGSAPSRWMQRCARLCPWDWCCWWAAPRICRFPRWPPTRRSMRNSQSRSTRNSSAPPASRFCPPSTRTRTNQSDWPRKSSTKRRSRVATFSGIARFCKRCGSMPWDCSRNFPSPATRICPRCTARHAAHGMRWRRGRGC